MFETRKQRIEYLKKFFPNQNSIGLEIGPNISPMLIKSENALYDIKYLDLVTTEVLITRAKEKGVELKLVPSIDYVHNFENSIAETVCHNTFDFILSSHVIEHIPNLIAHFQDISSILNKNGVYALIIPDMRRCFDKEKTPSTLGTVIEAFINQHKHAPLSAIIDEFKYAVFLDQKNHWSIDSTGTFSPKYSHSLNLIKNLLNKDKNKIINYHGHIWRFTPKIFEDIYIDCFKIGLIDLNLIDIKETQSLDFLCVLKK